MIQSVALDLDGEQVILMALPPAGYFTELFARPDAMGAGKTLFRPRLVQALRRVRPLARRALNTLRPPLVLMRARNPWTRLRLRVLG